MSKKHMLIITAGACAFLASWYALKQKQNAIDNPESVETEDSAKTLSIVKMDPMMLALLIGGIAIGAAYLIDLATGKDNK